MRQYYLSLSIVLCTITFGLWIYATLLGAPSFILPPLELHLRDAESILAAGKKIPLHSAGIYELELIQGISDTLAHRILEKKTEILVKAHESTDEKQHTALLIVKGIGQKKSTYYGRYLDFSRTSKSPTSNSIASPTSE